MDPESNLREQLRLALLIVNGAGEPDPHDALALAEHVLALHEWLARGGFLPQGNKEKQIT